MVAGSSASSAGALLRGGHHDGVEEDRRTAVDLVIGGNHLAALAFRAADLRRDDLQARADAFQRRLQRRHQPASLPSVTSTPTLRPFSVLGAFLIRLSAGDGFMSIGARAA